MDYSHEQQRIIDCDADRAAGVAFAGTGKTATAVGFARARPDRRILYLVFNKSAQQQAVLRMPNHVTSRTINALAYAEFGARFRHKLRRYPRLKPIKEALDPTDKRTYEQINHLVQTVTRWCHSADPKITARHFPPLLAKSLATPDAVDRFLTYARRLWHLMCDRSVTSIPMSHDGYLKIYQLRGRPLAERFDLIIVDEAQDLSPVTVDILLRQPIPILLLGDPHQSIYGFRGCVNAFDELAIKDRHPLTCSWRFGPELAGVCNAVLARFKGEENALIGAGPDTRIARLDPRRGPHAKIHRTFGNTLDTALTAALNGQRVAWVGGVDSYPLAGIEDLHRLYIGAYSEVRQKSLLHEFGDYERLRDHAYETEDRELIRQTRVVESHGPRIGERIAQLKQGAVSPDRADVIVSTAHKAKGLQFEQVILDDDFPDLTDPSLGETERDQETNLAYVAASRATGRLQVSPGMLDMLLG